MISHTISISLPAFPLPHQHPQPVDQVLLPSTLCLSLTLTMKASKMQSIVYISKYIIYNHFKSIVGKDPSCEAQQWITFKARIIGVGPIPRLWSDKMEV